MVNMLFWFIVQPAGVSDTIKTTVTSMTAVLTTTMSLRIILSVRGSLVALQQLAITFGIMVSFWIDYGISSS